jgi:O-antigen ligase
VHDRVEYISKALGQREFWLAALITALAVGTIAFFIADPVGFALAFAITLLLLAIFSFDLFVAAMVLFLPWHPLIDVHLPVRDLLLALPVVMFCGTWIRRRREGKSFIDWLFGSRLKKGIVLFAFVAIVTVFVTGYSVNRNSLRALTRLLSYITFFYAMAGWIENREQLVRVIKLLLVSTIAVDLFGLYQVVSGSYTDLYFSFYPFQDLDIEPWSGRITSLLFQFNSLAGYLNLVFPFGMACAVLAKRGRLKTLGIWCAALSGLAVFLTQSRGGVLALIGALVLTGWFLTSRWATRIKMMVAGVLVSALLIGPVLSGVQRFQHVDIETESTRLAAWGAAVILFTEHPAMGVGYGNYRTLFDTYVPGAEAESVDAHNLYLELLADTGIMGFAVFFAVIGMFILQVRKYLRSPDLVVRIIAVGAFGAIASALIHGFVDFLFVVSPQFGQLFFLILALGMCALRMAPEPVTVDAKVA